MLQPVYAQGRTNAEISLVKLLMSPCCSLSSPSLQDLFKGFARHLSHLLTADQNPARKTGELVIGMLDEVMSAAGARV